VEGEGGGENIHIRCAELMLTHVAVGRAKKSGGDTTLDRLGKGRN